MVNPQIAISEFSKSGREKLFFSQFTQKQISDRNLREILTNLVTNSLLSPVFVLSYKPEVRIKFSACWWFGNEKHSCFLLIVSQALKTLLQRYDDFNRIL